MMITAPFSAVATAVYIWFWSMGLLFNLQLLVDVIMTDRMAVAQFPRIFCSWSAKTIGLNDRRLFALNSL